MKRILAITAGLALAGAVVGTIVGLLVLLIASTIGRWDDPRQAVPFFASSGALFGLVLGPIAAWTLMRSVPIWRAMVETGAGTALGALVGVIIDARTDASFTLWLALVGFVAAAVRLRWSHRGPAPRRELL